MPRVSIVVPTYNSVAFVVATVESILGQTFSDFELLVSDHTSFDGTWEVLQRFRSDPRVRLTQIPAGGGAAANWNAVTSMARCELIKLVCGDDVLYPDCVRAQVAAFDEHPTAVLVACRRDIIDESGAALVRGRGLQGLVGPVPGREAIRQTVRAGTNIFGEPVCVLLRREVLIAAGGWDDRSPYLLDQATYARVAMEGLVVPVHRSLAGFRVSPQQWSVALSRTQATHARAFHHRIAAEHPGLLSRSDLLVGDARSTILAWARRMVYTWLHRRRTRRMWNAAGPR